MVVKNFIALVTFIKEAPTVVWDIVIMVGVKSGIGANVVAVVVE